MNYDLWREEAVRIRYEFDVRRLAESDYHVCRPGGAHTSAAGLGACGTRFLRQQNRNVTDQKSIQRLLDYTKSELHRLRHPDPYRRACWASADLSVLSESTGLTPSRPRRRARGGLACLQSRRRRRAASGSGTCRRPSTYGSETGRPAPRQLKAMLTQGPTRSMARRTQRQLVEKGFGDFHG